MTASFARTIQPVPRGAAAFAHARAPWVLQWQTLLPVQGAGVQPLTREQGSYMLRRRPCMPPLRPGVAK